MSGPLALVLVIFGAVLTGFSAPRRAIADEGLAAPVSAEGPAASTEDPDSADSPRLERLASLRRRAVEARRASSESAEEEALAHARRALAGAETALSAEDEGGADGELDLADAALTLAERLIARRHARAELEAARRREERARAAAATARDALEAALRERVGASHIDSDAPPTPGGRAGGAQ